MVHGLATVRNGRRHPAQVGAKMTAQVGSPKVEVKRALGPRGWLVNWLTGEHSVTEVSTKPLAVAEATRQLRQHPGGGRLIIYYADGRQESERVVDSDVPAAQLGATERDLFKDALSVRDTIKREGEAVDKILGGTNSILMLLGWLIGSSAVSTIISPEVQGALGDGWPAVFFATFTFCAGVAGATTLIRKSGFKGMATVGYVVAIFAIALAVANILGSGVLEIESVLFNADDSFPERLVEVVSVAVRTYGPVGTIVSGAVGIWLGDRAARIF